MDFEVPFSSVRKTPWITLNGQHIGDSQIIMELLQKLVHHINPYISNLRMRLFFGINCGNYFKFCFPTGNLTSPSVIIQTSREPLVEL